MWPLLILIEKSFLLIKTIVSIHLQGILEELVENNLFRVLQYEDNILNKFYSHLNQLRSNRYNFFHYNYMYISCRKSVVKNCLWESLIIEASTNIYKCICLYILNNVKWRLMFWLINVFASIILKITMCKVDLLTRCIRELYMFPWKL